MPSFEVSRTVQFTMIVQATNSRDAEAEFNHELGKVLEDANGDFETTYEGNVEVLLLVDDEYADDDDDDDFFDEDDLEFDDEDDDD